jgi:hemerythrin superfamily protein
MALAGTAVGLAASRLVPPLWAQLRGAAGSALGEDPFAELIQQHKKLLSLLDRMERTSAGNSIERTLLFLAFKRTIAQHALAEEDIAYPLLHEDAGRPEAAEHLYKEHADMKIHLFALQQSIRDDSRWHRHVRELRDEIARHARQEEDEEFPRLRELRQGRESATLNRNLRQEEALIL